MKCRAARRAIELRMDARSRWSDEVALDLHVASCAACERALARALALQELAAAWPEPASERLDVAGALARIRARIDAEETARAAPRSVSARRAQLAAALLLIALGAAALAAARLRRSDRAGAPELASAAQPEPAPAVPDRELDREPADSAAPPQGFVLRALHAAGPLDEARLAEARARTLDVLRALADQSYATADGPAAEQLALLLERELAPLRGTGWPLERIVAAGIGALEPAAQCAALRYLGTRGDALDLDALRAVLAAGEPADAARAAALALLDAERRGLPGLRTAALSLGREPSRAALAAALARLATPAERARAAIELERALDRAGAPAAPGGEAPVRDGGEHAWILARLAELGPPGAAALVRAGEAHAPLRPAVLAHLAALEPAAAAVAEHLAAAGPRLDFEFALALVRGTTPDAALGWLAVEAFRRDPRAALGALAHYTSDAALGAALELWSRHPRELEEAPEFAAVAAASSAAALRLAAELGALDPLAGESARARAGELFAFLLASDASAAAPAIFALATGDLLGREDRLLGLLAVGELGDESLEGPLAEYVARAPSGERRLAAAAFVAIDALAGEPGARRALAAAQPRAAERALAELARAREAPGRSLVRLGRALEDCQPSEPIRRTEP